MKAKILFKVYNSAIDAVNEHNFDGKCTEECRKAILDNMQRKFQKVLESLEIK